MTTPRELIDSYPRFEPPGTYMPTHKVGMSGDYVAYLATKRRPIDGTACVAVSKTRVDLCVLAYPTNYNDWHVAKSRGYSTLDELRASIDELVGEEAASCWGAA